MAVATYTPDLTLITAFNDTTGVSAYGGGASGLGAGADYAIEPSSGPLAVDKQVSASEKGFLFSAASAFTIGADDHFYIWCIVGTPGIADTRNNRGIVVNIGDDTSNFVKFHVNGNDTLPLGGLVPYAVRFVNTTLTNFRTLVGSPGTSPDSIGVGANITATAKFSNLGADVARIGTGYDILNGTGADPEADFAGIASNDNNTSQGIFRTTDGGFKLQGKLRIGSATTACEFLDLNTNVFVVDTFHSLHDFTEILIEHASSILTLTNVNFEALGTNNRGRLEAITSAATLTFGNVGFIGFGETVLGSGSTLTGCRWVGADRITANGATLTNSAVSGFEDEYLIAGQDETFYNNAPTTEGTFVAGTGYSVSDVITLDNGATITVDTLSGSAVATFTVTTQGRTTSNGTTLAQVSVAPAGGTGFTLTPEDDNLESAALIWNTSADPNGELDGMTFTKGVAATHAIEFTSAAPLTSTLTNVTFSGYSGTDGNKDSTLWFADRGSDVTWTVNITGGTTPTYKKARAGDTVNIVAGSVDININVKDTAGSNIQSARVLLKASNGTGPFPFEDSVTITRSGSIASVSHTAHGMATNDKIQIKGADQWEYNGVFSITNVTTNAYDYTVSGTPTTPATGTIEATFVALHDTTDVSGNVSATRVYPTNQPVTGVVRKSTGSPLYQTGPFGGTVNSATGFTANVQLVSDE
jgi:hypothetical protein